MVHAKGIPLGNVISLRKLRFCELFAKITDPAKTGELMNTIEKLETGE